MRKQKNPSRFTPRGKGQEGGRNPIIFLAHPLRANSSYKAILCFDPSPGPRHASHRIQWFLNLPPTGETMSPMHISPSRRPGPFPNLSGSLFRSGYPAGPKHPRRGPEASKKAPAHQSHALRKKVSLGWLGGLPGYFFSSVIRIPSVRPGRVNLGEQPK